MTSSVSVFEAAPLKLRPYGAIQICLLLLLLLFGLNQCTACGKNIRLRFVAVFSEIAWNFKAKVYQLIYSSYTHMMDYHQSISITITPPHDFSVFKNFRTKTHS